MLSAVHGIDLYPIASSDSYGNETIIHKTINRKMTERIGKALATASFGLIGQSTLLQQAKKLKPFMLAKTLSTALSVGQAIRNAGKSSNLALSLHECVGSKLLLEGIISKFHGYEHEGYYVGEIVINGIEKFKNSELRIWFKNENLIVKANMDYRLYQRKVKASYLSFLQQLSKYRMLPESL